MDKIKFSEVVLDDRIRRDYGDVKELAESLLLYGFIHPPAIDQNKTLVAGGRRWAALTEIMQRKPEANWHVDMTHLRETGILELGKHYTFKPTISIDHLGEMELEENIRRKSMSWQEECIGIAKVHRLKQNTAALNSQSWGDRQTAELFKISKGKVSYVLHIADRLKDEKSPLWLCDSVTDAIQKLAAIKLEEMNREIARQSVSQVKQNVSTMASNYTNKGASQDFFVQVPREVDLAAEFAMFTGTPAAGRPNGTSAPQSEGHGETGPQTASTGEPMLGTSVEKTVIELSKDLFNCNDEDLLKKLHGRKIDLLFFYGGSKVEAKFIELIAPDGWMVSFTDSMYPMDREDLLHQDHELIFVDTGKHQNKEPLVQFTKNYRQIWVSRGPKAKLAEMQGSSVHLGTADAERVLFGNDFSVMPDSLYTWLLKAMLKPGKLLVCPQVGSGSLVRACIKSGVRFKCAETNKDLFDRAFKVASQTCTQIFPNVEVR